MQDDGTPEIERRYGGEEMVRFTGDIFASFERRLLGAFSRFGSSRDFCIPFGATIFGPAPTCPKMQVGPVQPMEETTRKV